MYRMKEGRISAHGLFSVLSIMLITQLFLGIPRVLTKEAGSAGWLLIIMSAAIASIGVFIVVKLIKKFPGKNFIEIAEIVWGAPGRILVAVLMSFLFLFISIVLVREFAETILTTVLPHTPISIVALIFLAAMVFGAYNGLEVITRSSVLLFPFILVGLLSILLLTANFVDLTNLFPILGAGPDKLVFHALGKISLFTEIVFIGLISSNVNEPEKIPRQIWVSFLVSVALYVVVQLFYVSVFSMNAGEKLYVPLFQLARIIYMGRFVQRIEALYIFVWFFTGALKLTLSFYGGATALSRGFKIPFYQPLLFPLALLVFSLSFMPQSIVTAVHLDVNLLRNYGFIPAFVLPALLLLTSIIRGKGGKKGETKKAG